MQLDFIASIQGLNKTANLSTSNYCWSTDQFGVLDASQSFINEDLYKLPKVNTTNDY